MSEFSSPPFELDPGEAFVNKDTYFSEKDGRVFPEQLAVDAIYTVRGRLRAGERAPDYFALDRAGRLIAKKDYLEGDSLVTFRDVNAEEANDLTPQDDIELVQRDGMLLLVVEDPDAPREDWPTKEVGYVADRDTMWDNAARRMTDSLQLPVEALLGEQEQVAVG
jgi:hypothetical protein